MKIKKLILIFQHLTLAISLLIAGAVIFLSIAAHAGETDINSLLYIIETSEDEKEIEKAADELYEYMKKEETLREDPRIVSVLIRALRGEYSHRPALLQKKCILWGPLHKGV